MNRKDIPSIEEIYFVISTKLFMCRKKWGDEVFINYSSHVDNVDVEIYQGKWKYDDSNFRISFNTYLTDHYNQILEDLDIYYEQGFDYFLNNDKPYWYKKYGGHND